MKANKEFRPNSKEDIFDSGDAKKGKKLVPDKKPKNEKKELYDVDDFEEEYDLHKYKRESIADFYDDGEEDEEELDDEDFEEEEYDEEQDEEFDDEIYDEDETNHTKKAVGR
ncbi:hypothetical protein [uncultured Acetobacteroides sp.]|uniref:hypothetical protein n=1 Tax=uncultured Acetobacteroides sp. TaxID=1760811 RepID=UPI0029F4C926|nr:hypothetical protein [uncultured Acetobacteroides sp.]